MEEALLAEELRTAAWIMCAKSQMNPTTEISWMGKRLDGQRYTLMQSAKYMATATAMWV